MEQFLWFLLGGLLLLALGFAIFKMSARAKREEAALSPEELKIKRALERLAGDF